MPFSVTPVTESERAMGHIATMNLGNSQRMRQQGLTSVELIVVVAVFVALAAVALPRYAVLEEETRLQAVGDLATEIRAHAAQSFAIWQSANHPSSLSQAGRPMMLVHGYPSAADMRTLVVGDAMFQYEGGRYVYTAAGEPVAGCYVTYIPPAGRLDAPQIDVVVEGC